MRNEFKSFAERQMGVNGEELEKYVNRFNQQGIGSSIIKESNDDDYDSMNVFTRLMADRIIFLGEHITQEVANIISAQLLYLDTIDSTRPIELYINSEGGSVVDGLGIYDMMNFINAPVYTICVAKAASMAAILLSAGEKGHRTAFNHSRIMIHELWGRYEGKFHDIRSNAAFTETLHEDICKILANNTGKTYDEIDNICKSDYWMRGSDAVEFGIIDKIIDKRGH